MSLLELLDRTLHAMRQPSLDCLDCLPGHLTSERDWLVFAAMKAYGNERLCLAEWNAPA